MTITIEATPTPSANKPTARTYEVVGELSRLIERLPKSAQIELRRAEAKNGTRTMAFARLCVEPPLENLLREGPENERDEREMRWSVIAGIIASCGHGSSPLGSALVAANVSETRVLRLLRSREARLWGEARRVCEQITKSGRAVDLTSIARLILSDGESFDESVRVQIAQDYYGALKREKSV